MNSPQNHIWGPALWTILHTSAEKIGSMNLKRLPHEEHRIWTNLLSSLRYSIPCPICKKHYSTFYRTYPPPITKESIRSWLFELHYQVNQHTDKPNTITLDQVQELYSIPINYTQHYHIVIHQMISAIPLGVSKREDIQRTSRFLQELKRYYDYF